MPKLIDLTGQTFGRWTVIALARKTERREYIWSCTCACGTASEVDGNSLRQGRSLSCGCINSERLTTHGDYQNSTYNSWSTMKQRCTNPSTPGYEKYGGRGITYDPEWESYENFKRDMGQRPEGTTLDRQENDQGYSKNNCRWASNEVQQNNKSNNIQVELAGENFSVSQLAQRYSLPASAIYARHYRGVRGEALVQPLSRKPSVK